MPIERLMNAQTEFISISTAPILAIAHPGQRGAEYEPTRVISWWVLLHWHAGKLAQLTRSNIGFIISINYSSAIDYLLEPLGDGEHCFKLRNLPENHSRPSRIVLGDCILHRGSGRQRERAGDRSSER